MVWGYIKYKRCIISKVNLEFMVKRYNKNEYKFEN